jgi:hypothetical protein
MPSSDDLQNQLEALRNELESMREDIGFILSLDTQLRSIIEAHRINFNTPRYPYPEIAKRCVELLEKYNLGFD